MHPSGCGEKSAQSASRDNLSSRPVPLSQFVPFATITGRGAGSPWPAAAGRLYTTKALNPEPAGSAHPQSGFLSPPQFAQKQMDQIWMNHQNKLAALSSNSKRVVVPGSGHVIPLDKPEVLVHAIGQVVEAVRRR